MSDEMETKESTLLDWFGGEGWYEFVRRPAATTHIAHISESEYIYVPETGVNEGDLLAAKANNEVYKLSRVGPISDESDSNLVKHAKKELALIGEEQSTVDGYIRIVKAFSDMNHSGGSASVAIPVINELLQFNNLSPLTDDPDEWEKHSPDLWDGDNEIYQNRRNGKAFSKDGGKTYYLLSDGSTAKTKDPKMYISVPKKTN